MRNRIEWLRARRRLSAHDPARAKRAGEVMGRKPVGAIDVSNQSHLCSGPTYTDSACPNTVYANTDPAHADAMPHTICPVARGASCESCPSASHILVCIYNA